MIRKFENDNPDLMKQEEEPKEESKEESKEDSKED